MRAHPWFHAAAAGPVALDPVTATSRGADGCPNAVAFAVPAGPVPALFRAVTSKS